MNDWDKDNLNFLLTISSETFEDWLSQADEDDVEYAIELLRAAKSELIVQQMEVLDTVQDTSTANNFIEQIRKK
jgi:putative SOS response-associated peptidase YedK